MKLYFQEKLEMANTTHLLQDYLINDEYKVEEKNGCYSKVFELLELAEKLNVDHMQLVHDIEILFSNKFISTIACNPHPDQIWYTVHFKP